MKKLLVNELRIGNWVNEHGIPIGVTPNLILRLYQINIANKICIDISPIPLTQKLLVEFGFEYREDLCGNGDNYYNGYIKNGFRIAVISDEFAYWIDIEDYYYSFALRKIKYVHKLQNLYFEIKNEELI